MTTKVVNEKVRIRQTGSVIRRCGKQALHLKALGLRGIGSEKELVLNDSILGLIKKVRHMVKVI
ncbi:MAG: 50S ribosomal protein L30 [Holosporales bacterium]|jgi:ribosomal protein L30|nr:50S ribosomal protein L30 [Holosporales bacterium]